ncbi:MAG: hypothetical protein QCI38_07905 [Candidatus Thermoplasmatota archaeon]|nr:hypothetical protein [Candidatus Thermoplasmatota archaeon]
MRGISLTLQSLKSCKSFVKMVVDMAKTSVKERKEDNKIAEQLALVAGILLLVAGVTGAAAWETIKGYAQTALGGDEMIGMVFMVLILLASLGGLMVLVGAFMYINENVRTANFMLMLGVGMGLVGLIISLIVGISEGSILNLGGMGLGFAGIVLSVFAKMKAENVEKKK